MRKSRIIRNPKGKNWKGRKSKEGLTSILGILVAVVLTRSIPAQLPPLPSPSASGVSQASPVGATEHRPAIQTRNTHLQVYNVPSEFVGTVGAHLQLKYHNDSRVAVTTEPNTGQLMVMAPPAIHRQISAQIASLMKQNNIQPGNRGSNVASPHSQQYALQTLTWREFEDAIGKLAGRCSFTWLGLPEGSCELFRR